MTGISLANRFGTLLLATTEDPASMALHKAVLARGAWKALPAPAGTALHALGSCRLWKLSEPFLHCDNVDVRWQQSDAGGDGALPRELLFLSRHASASGEPCLTVHPIGVPDGTTPSAQLAITGGRAGAVVPPSPRLASLYRRLRTARRAGQLPDGFGVSLEATHHGPHVGTPSAFVEIGSTEAEWGRADAAASLVGALLEELAAELAAPDGADGPGAPPPTRGVVVGVGGGHYAPKLGDVASKQGAAVGHILASYAVGFAPLPEPGADGDGDGDGPVASAARVSLEAGGGAAAILEAVRATRLSYHADVPLSVQVDKRAFEPWKRDAVLALLEEGGLPYRVK